ncbi:MAG: hypothetical protein R2789_10370 [Microthrixaceae bacterium]
MAKATWVTSTPSAARARATSRPNDLSLTAASLTLTSLALASLFT